MSTEKIERNGNRTQTESGKLNGVLCPCRVIIIIIICIIFIIIIIIVIIIFIILIIIIIIISSTSILIIVIIIIIIIIIINVAILAYVGYQLLLIEYICATAGTSHYRPCLQR